MAPFYSSFTLATATATTTASCPPFFSQTATQHPRLKTHAKQTHRIQVSCNVSSHDHEKPLNTNTETISLDSLQNVDRRNLLLGLGGIYTTVNLPSAFAHPISSPTFELPSLQPSCKPAGSGFNAAKGLLRTTACCPPSSKNGPERNYDLDKITGPTRIRKPIHSSPDDVTKYMKALEIMRTLPDDDPRSFTNQAKIHCAYCNGSYKQSGQELQIHNTWLFFPFHRWYLYFFERILGDLIQDPTFALPYWNWDNLDGMEIPNLFVNENQNSEPNSLYDEHRNVNHIKKNTFLDLDYQGKDRTDGFDQKEINLATMNRQMIRNAFDEASFFGGKYVAGNEPVNGKDNVVGSVEAGCHTAVHRWVGNPNSPNGEDMANFYSAGYDPLFYVHHANVDRMWTLWKEIGGKEPDDDDWRNASYVFYDEKQNPVRVYNKDSVNLDQLKFRYAKSETPWTDRPPRSRCNRPGYEIRTTSNSFTDINDVKFPLSLPTTVRVKVPRPVACINRDAGQKKKEKEILCFNGIEFDGTSFVKFDVYVNECDTEFTPCDSENVGSFAAIPHTKGGAMGCKSGIRFSLTELLEETGAEGKESITVTIVPRTPGNNASIDNIEIRLIPVFHK